MELFPAQPDLSLQISQPNNNKSTASGGGGGGGWISASRTIATNREDEDQNLQDHGDYSTSSFYKSTSSPIFTPPITKPSFTDTSTTTTTTTCGNNIDLHMSNSIRPIPQAKQPILFSNHHYFKQNNNTSTCNGATTLHFSNSSSFYHKVAPHQQRGGVDMANNMMTSGGGGVGCSPNEIMGFLRPIRGIPIYQHQNHNNSISTNATPPTAACLSPNNNIHMTGFPSSSQLGLLRSSSSRFLSRFPAKRSMRAPRMRWTTTLHARFVHAVDLLGGHDRATPKSVLELMDVKDLTLAHVKSHLQMYRTVKTTDRAAASSGQSDLFENGSSGDTSEDQIFDNIQNPRRSQESEKEYQGLWTNSSSREAWLHGKQRDCEEINIPSLQLREEKKAKGFSKAGKKEMDGKCISSYERISEVSSSSQLSFSDASLLFCSNKNPNLDLEFTLGRSLC